MRAIEIGLLKRVAGEWPRSRHPILVADRGLGAIALFHAWDAWGWEGIIRGKGSTHGAVSPGVWRTLSRTPGDFGRRIPSLNRLFVEAMGVS